MMMMLGLNPIDVKNVGFFCVVNVYSIVLFAIRYELLE